LLRVLLVPLFAWLLLAYPDDPARRWLATAVFAIALATDFIDGRIARRYNLITDFGKLWDPIADKAITGMAFVGLSLLGELWWWVTIVILVREWGITALRFVIIKYGVMAANRGGKAKTMLQTVALLVWLAPLPGFAVFHWLAVILMGLALVLTVVTGLDYVRAAFRLRADWQARQAGQTGLDGQTGRPGRGADA
jgi:CDP-diacylglycerol--glycerol-3-phosphate 3-phosphatidyltransferase